MGVDRRLKGYSGMRVDWPHLRAIESAESFDFDMLLRGMMTGLNKPYLINGFDLQIPNAAIAASSLTVTVAGATLLHSSATESGTILNVPTTQPDEVLSPSNTNVSGAFQANTLNYVGLDYVRVTDPNTTDQTAGWSPSQNLEFQRTVPIGNILRYKFVISTNGFSTYLPLWVVKTTNTGAVQYITKATTDFWRLGTGGANPNPLNSFNWGNLTNTQVGANGRREWISTLAGVNPLTIQPGDDPFAFNYGDFTIKTLKDFVDAVETRFKEITNSSYWYFDSNFPSGDAVNLKDLQFDSIGSVLTGKGALSYNLVLQSSLPSYGVYQDQVTDPTGQPGDFYIQGLTSFTAATMTAFNGGQLIVNSLTSGSFIYDEILTERRLWRPLANKWLTTTYSRDGGRYASTQRITSSVAVLPNNIASWSFTTLDASSAQGAWSIVTVNTSSAHGLFSGQFARVEGLLSTGAPPNGVHRIIKTPSTTSLQFITNILQSGTNTVAGTNGAVLDSSERQPYNPSLPITAFATGSGTTGYLTVPNHNFLAPFTASGDFLSTSNQLSNVSSMVGIFVGSKIFSANYTGGSTHVLGINGTTITTAATSLNTVSAQPFTVKQVAMVHGLQATGHTATDLDGSHDVAGLTVSNQVIIDFGFAITGPAVTAGAEAELQYYQMSMSVTGASPNEYNIINVFTLAIANDKLQFLLGPDSLPFIPNATGPIQMDGVVSTSTVLDPVMVSTITNDGAGNLTVTTFVPHTLVTGGPQNFTIFGDSTLSQYIRSYSNVNIVVTSPTVFKINGTGIISVASYTNSGNDKTFVLFANNPYPGPVQWSSDIVVKGIIGDLSLTIPQTAVVDTSDPDVSPNANQFNVNGQTGTAYLQDGEVLYVKLERNKPVSNSTIFSTAGASSIITTASIMTDAEGHALIPGDFIKFADEPDNYWLKIATINATTVTLVTDRGQAPDIRQRPAHTGPMLYTKGAYPLVYVKKHYLVEASADTYWLAVRRDNNGAISRVYFRDLELSPGEVRPITDGISNNLLIYTGANTEGAVNPNYSISDTTGDEQFETSLTIQAVDNLTQMVTFTTDAGRVMQHNDQIRYFDGSQYHYFTIEYIITSRTVILQQATGILAALQTVSYLRENQFIVDTDNLTLALRKEDRQAGHTDTSLTRPVYDESVYVQQINMSGAGTVRSGSYIYKGTISNPTALAWVLHGNAPVTETIEGAAIVMPGGHSTVGPNAILANIVFGTFSNGDGLFQNGSATGRTVNNPSNPPFTAPSIYGDTSGGGVELVLPPNKRTQISSGSGFVVYGNHSFYKQSANLTLSGEELLLIVNDGIREAQVDYNETFGGPKAKIQMIRFCPPNTRLRFRCLSAFGSAVVSKAADVTLQSAYNAGSTIQCAPGTPVQITSDNVNGGTAALIVRGSLFMNGGGSAAGGIFNESGDQTFQIGNETNKPKTAWTALEAVKTHTDHPGSAVIRTTAAQVVTGAAGTIITGSELTLTDNFAYRIKINATARRSDGPLGVASFTLEGTFYALSGTAIAAGQPISTINGFDGDGENYAIMFAVSSNQVMAVVFGTSGSTLQWALTMEQQGVGAA